MNLLVLLLLGTAHARWMTIEEAGSVIENYSVEHEVAASGASTQTVDYTVRVQAEDAKVSASLFTIDYNSFTDKVEILEAYSRNGDKIIPVEAAGIEDRDKGESKEYDALKIRSVVFPQVEIGSHLHIRYVIKTAKPLMEKRWSSSVTLMPGSFVEKLHVTVKSEVPLYYRVHDPQHLVTVRQHDKRQLDIVNRKRLPGWVHAEKDVFFHPAGITEVGFSTHEKWPEFFATLDKDFAAILAAPVPKPLQSWLNKAKALPLVSEQILYLMNQMSHDFRYFGDWRRHNGGVVPRTLAEIEKSRYGDCKDLASLLTALLRALKIDANVALVRRGENAWGVEPDYELPEMGHFNHAIVQVKVGTQVWWLDATNPVSSLEAYPDIAGRPAWILQAGQGHFARLPPALSPNFVHAHDYEYRFKSQDAVNVTVTANLRHLAPYRLANELMMAPRSGVLSETLEYFSEGQEVHSFHYTKEPQTTRTLADLTMALEYQAGRVTFDAGKAAFFVIPDGFLNATFYETETRESDLRLSGEPFVFQGVRRLKDTKMAQALPEPCQVRSEWMDLRREIKVDGRDVVILQNVDLKKPFIMHSEFRSAPFHKLQADTKKCFYRAGILVETKAW